MISERGECGGVDAEEIGAQYVVFGDGPEAAVDGQEIESRYRGRGHENNLDNEFIWEAIEGCFVCWSADSLLRGRAGDWTQKTLRRWTDGHSEGDSRPSILCVL